MRTFSTVPSGMRARSRTSASPSGLPAGSTIRTAYVPLPVPGSRLSSTRGRPAKRGETSRDPGSAGSAATCRGGGSLTVGRDVSADLARPLAVSSAAARGGALFSADGVRAPRGAAEVAASREGRGCGSLATDEPLPRVDRSTEAPSFAGALDGASATDGFCAAPGFSGTPARSGAPALSAAPPFSGAPLSEAAVLSGAPGFSPLLDLSAAPDFSGARDFSATSALREPDEASGVGAGGWLEAGVAGALRCARLWLRLCPQGERKYTVTAMTARPATSHGNKLRERARLKLRMDSSRSASSSSSAYGSA